MFVCQIPVKNLALSTVNYLVTNPSLHEMKTYFFLNLQLHYSRTFWLVCGGGGGGTMYKSNYYCL